VEAAAALISARGVASATMEAIAADADCSVPSLHAVFGGRDNLLQAVYDRYLPPLDMEGVISGASAAGLRETVRAIYLSLARLLLQGADSD
jgi:AcrR family transcriptional regulator